MIEFDTLPASKFDIETLATLYTRTFEGYVYTAIITPPHLESFIRVEDLKLDLSPVLRVNNELVAFTTVGLRGTHAYCRGFGVIPEYRGKGLANALCAAMVKNAWEAGAEDMALGVLKNNHGAVQTYRRAGFEPTRELHSVEWTGELSPNVANERRFVPSPTPIEPARALDHYDALHNVPAVWNRDLSSLEKMDDLEGLAVWEGDVVRGCVLFHVDGDAVEILDLAATRVEDGVELLRAVQGRAMRVVCYNEPEVSLIQGAFRAAGFAVTQKRWEMKTVHP